MLVGVVDDCVLNCVVVFIVVNNAVNGFCDKFCFLDILNLKLRKKILFINNCFVEIYSIDFIYIILYFKIKLERWLNFFIMERFI